MGLKRQDDRWKAEVPGVPDGVSHQGLVTEMNPVEVPQRRDGFPEQQCATFDMTKNLHVRLSRANGPLRFGVTEEAEISGKD
jgi:hypothetical protein